jgi:hypothetical protein
MDMAALIENLNGQSLIPDVLGRWPQARTVLDRYGLRGCGGANGPVESLGFFARAHDVPLARLLSELELAATESKAKSDEQFRPSLADSIYRPFFLAGIATVLTLGAVWGAYLLLKIGLSGDFHAAGLHEINAHGHAQIFGWVGLFVMGFAYQAFPRFKHTSLVHPRCALATLVMLLMGLIARSIAQPLVAAVPWLWRVAVGGSALEIAAIGIFAVIIVATLVQSGKGFACYDYYILAALSWFVVQAVYESVYLTATLAASGNELLQLVATWQAPLRDVQIHGFALLMILGVSQRAFHHFYGLPAPHPKLSLAVLPVLNLAVIGESLGLVLMRQAGHAWAALWYLSVIVLTVATAVLVGSWRIFSTPKDADRSLKFLRLAYVWLFISLAMLIALPAYQAALSWFVPTSEAARLGFSHAFYGATRHAVTVGFISLMIVGVSSKVVPTLNGVDLKRLSPLWGPFVLINVGCFLRVTGQSLTDWMHYAFPLTGASGILEVTGLALWGTHLALIMAGKPRLRPVVASDSEPPLASREIRASDTIAAVLSDEPRLLNTLVDGGLTLLAGAHARQTFGRVVTLRQACLRMGVNEERLIVDLNQARRNWKRLELPLVLPSHDPIAQSAEPVCQH